MTTFRVWAPIPTKVEVQLGTERIPMMSKEGDWWSIDLPAVGPGTDYAFVLDNEGPLPDPRSPWQPAGIHGPSRVVDHSMFPWTDKHWQAKPLTAAIMYELHVGTFTPEGTFAAAIEKLPHLVDLGITHVEVMPVNEFLVGGAGGTTGLTYMLRTTCTAARTDSNTSSMRVTAMDWRSSSTWCTTTSARQGTMYIAAGRTLPPATPRRGDTQSIWTGPTATRCAASSVRMR